MILNSIKAIQEVLVQAKGLECYIEEVQRAHKHGGFQSQIRFSQGKREVIRGPFSNSDEIQSSLSARFNQILTGIQETDLDALKEAVASFKDEFTKSDPHAVKGPATFLDARRKSGARILDRERKAVDRLSKTLADIESNLWQVGFKNGDIGPEYASTVILDQVVS